MNPSDDPRSVALASDLDQRLRREGRLPELEASIRPIVFRTGIWERLFGSGQPPVAELQRIEPHHALSPFLRHVLVWVVARQPRVGHPLLPSASSMGLFAQGPSSFTHITGSRKALPELLRQDGRPLADYDPALLAPVVGEVLVDEKGTYCVIESEAQLRRPDPLNYGEGYELDEKGWQSARPGFTEPQIVRRAPDSCALEFCAARGWMHDKRELLRVTVVARYAEPGYRTGGQLLGVEISTATLTKRLFSATRAVIY